MSESIQRDASIAGNAGSGSIAAIGTMGVSMSGLFAQWFRGLTINAHERLALAHLWEHGPMTMSDLGSRIPLSRAAVTALTDRLEALGYVQRTPDEHDRRRTVLRMTARPEGLVDPMVRAWLTDMGEVTSSFDATELAAVRRFAEAMRVVNHRHAERLRQRSDDELPGPDARPG